nr:integrase, catalytic region, zinc finger, CCHC-type, peptidase aspartic, catalytic [Tanacetum cinerariifolium]
MANLSEDIQCADSDTRPPMLDRTDFASWQQRIRLYCQGKENGVNILKSINKGPFQMGIFQETLVEGTEGASYLGLSPIDNLIENLTNTLALLTQSYKTFLPQTNNQLRTSSNTRNQATVQDDRVVVQNVQGRLNRGHIARNCTQPKRLQNSNYFKDKKLLMQAQENGVALDEEQLLFFVGGQDNAIDEDVDEQPVHDLALNVDNVFQAEDCDAFDYDVDEAPTTQTMFMANLSSAYPVYDEAEHEMHNSIQPNHFVDSHANYTSDSNMILYDQYVKDNAVPGVQSNVPYVPNDAYMIIYNDMYEPHAQSVSKTSQNTIVDSLLTAKLATYKEQVELYERRAKFELTEREQKIDEQLRIVITDRNFKEETLKKELHSIKLQLASTINHNKSMNFLATFTPQKQLTPEQIFWSQDHIKIKAKALKEQTTASRPIKALTVYPSNIPASLVLRVLPTKIQVKINIFTLIQLFLEFDKTCKKRITPTGLTERERCFEQTKECYLNEVIPFFKTLNKHFEGIQKALTKEIKEIKDVFDELEAEVDQNVVDRKHDEIERKNLLIANDNLIDECLSKEVFYVAKNSEVNVSRFTKMHVAHTIVEARCLELKAELSNLRDKIHNDNHNELVNRFFNLEHYKELYDSIKITRAKLIEQTTALITKNVNLKAQILSNVNSVIKDHVKPIVLAPGKYAIYVEPIPPRLRNKKEVHLDYLRHFKECVKTIREIVKEDKVVRPLDSSIVSDCHYTKHSQELLEYAIDTCPSQPRSNTKKNRISPTKGVNKMKVEEHPRTNKSHLRTMNRVDSSSRSKHTVVQIVLWYLDLGCSKHMTEDRSRLMNFVKNFIETVRFGNDHFGAIMGYGDYVIGNSVISRVYYVEGLGHNLFSVRQFSNSDLEVAFRKHSFYVRDTNEKGHCILSFSEGQKTNFASWQQRIRLYCRGKENGVNILKSIDEGPFQMGIIRETLAEGTEGAPHLGPERPRVYYDLSPEEKDMYNADIRATNILLQGLPKDIYTLINRETIHAYHVRFAKLINDMRNIKMTMFRMQLNSKFVNNMLPEWGRFVTTVKLNRGLRNSNYDQLYAYLKQHEAHANENKMILDRFTQHTVDPLALMSNVSHQQHYSQSSTTLPSTYVPPHLADNAHLDSGLSPTDNLIKNLTNTLALLTQSYKTFLPQTNNQLRTSSNRRNQATVQDGRVVVQNVQGRLNRGQGNNPQGRGASMYEEAQNRVRNANPDKMLLMQAQENRVALDEEQLLFLADDCDAFDSDVDEAPTAQTMFMVNLSSTDPVYDESGLSYDSDILSEVHDHDHYHDAVCEHHEEHKMHDNVQPNHVGDLHADYMSNGNMIPYDQYVKDNAVLGVKSNVSSIPNDAYTMIYNDMYEPHAQSVSKLLRNIVVDNSLTAELATYKEKFELYERRAMFELTKREQNVDEQLRIVITDCKFKEETLKKELHSVKLQLASTINHNKLMVEEVTSLKKDFKQKENKYLEEFLDMKSLKEKALTIEIKEIKDVFEELEAEVDQNVVDRKHNEIERKNLLIVNDNLIVECLSKEVFYVATNSELNVSRFTKMHVAYTIVEARCLELEAELSNLPDKIQNDNHNELVNSVSKDHVKPIVLAAGKYAIDLEPIPSRLRNNREAHLYYLRHLKESVETIREIVEKAKVIHIFLWYLDSGCSKHMMGDHSRLLNFIKKFIGTVRFGNDHFGAIMGYGDYVIGDSVISRVYYVEGLGHNLFFVRQFYDSDLEVAFRKHSCAVRGTDGVELIKGSCTLSRLKT